MDSGNRYDIPQISNKMQTSKKNCLKRNASFYPASRVNNYNNKTQNGKHIDKPGVR